jgi:hypothetical protein
MNDSTRPGAHPKILWETVGAFGIVELSAHAQTRMKERGITETQVLDTLRWPDGSLPALPGRKRIFRNLSKRTAAVVVYLERSDRIVVITTYKRERKPRRRR